MEVRRAERHGGRVGRRLLSGRREVRREGLVPRKLFPLTSLAADFIENRFRIAAVPSKHQTIRFPEPMIAGSHCINKTHLPSASLPHTPPLPQYAAP